MPGIGEALKVAAARFVGSESAMLDAQLLLCEVLACNTAHLHAWPEKLLDTDQAERFEALVRRREQGEPVAYIRGYQEFFSRDFLVDEHTLIPRPDTECLVEFVLERFDQHSELNVIDLGTGSGAIAVTLACERPRWRISATDLSPDTLAIARQNADRHHARVDFHQQDWLAKPDARYHLIISNPPYIASGDPHLELGDVRFEPSLALVSGADGLDAIRSIVNSAQPQLAAGGWLALEHGYDQQQSVAQIIRQAGFGSVHQGNDYAGLPRFTAARREA